MNHDEEKRILGAIERIKEMEKQLKKFRTEASIRCRRVRTVPLEAVHNGVLRDMFTRSSGSQLRFQAGPRRRWRKLFLRNF